MLIKITRVFEWFNIIDAFPFGTEEYQICADSDKTIEILRQRKWTHGRKSVGMAGNILHRHKYVGDNSCPSSGLSRSIAKKS